MLNKLTILLALSLAACASNPNKAEPINTKMTHDETVSGDLHVGVKNGNMIVQRKVQAAEMLRDIQIEVYTLEDHVYGVEKYGSLGIYGVLKECREKVSSKENGGTGHLAWTEALDRVTDQEEAFKIGLDEKDRLVGVSEEYLKDRIDRFRQHRITLQRRQTDLQDKLSICNTELKSNRFDMKVGQN